LQEPSDAARAAEVAALIGSITAKISAPNAALRALLAETWLRLAAG